jgi:uncharacterized membrane protein YccC
VKRQALQLLFSVNTFAAAMLALYIGFALGLPRPYWAMTTAYIVSQPLSGALRSKGIYRIFGTMLGGSVALLLIPPLANAPVLLSLAMALWVAICLYLSLLDRTPRAYIFMLAGYTAAIIGFPVAPAPTGIYDVVVARVEEIGLGVISATVIHSLLFPQAVGPALTRRIQAWINDARTWSLDVLAGADLPATDHERRKLAADIIQIRILSTHLPFDTSNLKETTLAMRTLQDRMSFLLPLMSAVGDRLRVLRAAGASPPALEAAVADVKAWLSSPEGSRADGEALVGRLATLSPPLGQGAPWSDLVLENLQDRLSQYIRAVEDVRDLRSAIQAGSRRLPATLDRSAPLRLSAGLHRDRYLAFLSGLAVFAAVIACCSLWIGLSWQEGSVAALSAAIFSSFFAFQDDPAPTIGIFLKYTLYSIPITALYQFAILPRIDGFPMLALSLAPPFLIAGYCIANPKFTVPALAMAIGVGNGLALAETFSADFAGFLSTNISQVVGLFAALVATQLCRSVGADFSARRILRSGWREIARVADSAQSVNRTELTVRMLDRVGLLASRLTPNDPRAGPATADALNDVRVSLNVQELGIAEAPGTRGREHARHLLAGVARGYRTLARAPASEIHGVSRPTLEPALLTDLDECLCAAAEHAASSAQMRGVARALVSLRRTLFPEAAPYAPAAHSPMESPT